jgi:hypothetical protein
VAVIAASGAVAVLQMLDFGFAWDLREDLAHIQGKSLADFQAFQAKRPMGFSYSPIHLATQLCLAFAAYTALRAKEQRQAGLGDMADPKIVAALMVFLFACIATGTRSPMLGAVFFFMLYAAGHRGSWLPLMVLLGGALAYLAWPWIMAAFTAAQPRIVRADDASAQGRTTMYYYGWLLFSHNPLGYGFAFKPFTLWGNFWHELYSMPSPNGIRETELHNYVLSMVNTYGIGLLLFLPPVAGQLLRSRATLLFFVPYICHIMFHNSGPFWNDTILWFVVAVLSVTTAEEVRPVRRWRRPKIVPRRYASPEALPSPPPPGSGGEGRHFG